MEYPELHKKEKDRLEKTESRHERIAERLVRSRKIYAKHLETAEKKGEAFALYEAYLDDEDDDETGSEPEIAQAIWEDENLGHTQKLIENKAGQISLDEKGLKKLDIHIRRRRGLIGAIASFNPSRFQADDETVQKEFFFTPDGKWLEEHKRRRREQGSRTNSMFKTFQDIFTRPEYRIIPKAEGKFGQMDFDALPLAPVIVDPARISDTFLAEFENREFGLYAPHRNIHELDRLRAKKGMIPALKRFFYEHVSPTPRSSWDDADLNYRVLVVQGYEPRHDGKIIMPHFDSSEHPDIRRKIPNVYSDAYSARRKATRFFPGYEKESGRLAKIRWNIWQAKEVLGNIKKDGTIDDDQYAKSIEYARSLLLEAVNLLGRQSDTPSRSKDKKADPRRPDNIYKAAAFDRLITTSELTDIKGRLNKGVSLAKLVPIYKDLETRLEEVDDTSIAGPEDQNTLNAIINQSEIVLGSYREALRAYIENGNLQPFEALKGSLQKLNVRPFNLYAGRLMECFESMNLNSDRQARVSEATKAFTITQLFFAQKEVESLIANWNEDTVISAKMLTDVLSKVGDLQVHGHEKPFNDLKNHLEFVLKETTGEIIHKQPRDGLKEIDFEKILEGIL